MFISGLFQVTENDTMLISVLFQTTENDAMFISGPFQTTENDAMYIFGLFQITENDAVTARDVTRRPALFRRPPPPRVRLLHSGGRKERHPGPP